MHNNLANILDRPEAKIYFVGIGGIAMSAAAGLAREFGKEVAGSDGKDVYAPARDVLDNYKIPYKVGYSADNIKKQTSVLYILSAGEDEKNPEVAYVLKNNLARASFPELLFELSKDKLRAVVAGTHGKSTTTGLLGHLLKNLDDSSFMAGAVLQNYGSNFYKGDGHYFVFEGDEYKSQFDDPTPKFHYYKPDILILTNLEFDHPDMFESVEQMEREFAELIEFMPEDGLIVYNADDARLVRLVHKSNVASVSFALDNEADFTAHDISYEGEYTKFSVSNRFSKTISSQILGAAEDYKIRLPGKMNVYNALAGIAAVRALGFAYDQIALDLLTYTGVKRRFELVGVKNGVTLIDDYAHHPTAVRETLEAARLRYPKAKIWAIFEPHTFSRTKATLDDLAKSFGAADEVLISEIYPARENAKDATISSQDVVNRIRLSHPLFSKEGEGLSAEASAKAEGSSKHIRLVHDEQSALDVLKAELKPSDVVIVMAVGSFNRLAYELKENL